MHTLLEATRMGSGKRRHEKVIGFFFYGHSELSRIKVAFKVGMVARFFLPPVITSATAIVCLYGAALTGGLHFSETKLSLIPASCRFSKLI